MSHLTRQIRILNIHTGLMVLLACWLAYGFGKAVIDRKWVIAADQRAIAVAKMYNEISEVVHDAERRDLADDRNRVAETLRRLDLWQVTDDFRALGYPNAQIRPVAPFTGKPLLPSIITGREDPESLKSVNSSSSDPQRLFTQDADEQWVLRISGLQTFGVNTVVVNGDIPIKDVIKRHWVRMALQVVLIIWILVQARRIRKMPNAAQTDTLVDSSETQILYRILAAAMEVLEVDVCIAEMDERGNNSIVFATRDFHRLMGYDRGELDGAPLEIFIVNDRKSWHKEQVRRFHAQDDEIEGRVVNPVTKQGEVIEVNLRVRRTPPVFTKRYLVASVRR